MASVGRPRIFTPEVGEVILERLANGESLVAICRDDDMPSVRSVLRWVGDDADFGTEYARAREAQAEFMDDKITTAADMAGADPQAARVKIDAYKWRAAKLAPKKYGDATTIKHADADGDKIDMDDVGRATRLAAIFAEIEKRKANDVAG